MERKRPQTRGVVNPVDHPHGGGEGKTSGGRSPVSPWGQSAKGLNKKTKEKRQTYYNTKEEKEKIMTRSSGKVHLCIQVY